MAAMCTAIMRRSPPRVAELDRDVIFAAVADEEAGCDLGSRFWSSSIAKVEAEYAIGESGGFSLHIGETRRFIRCRSPRKGSAGFAHASPASRDTARCRVTTVWSRAWARRSSGSATRTCPCIRRSTSPSFSTPCARTAGRRAAAVKLSRGRTCSRGSRGSCPARRWRAASWRCSQTPPPRRSCVPAQDERDPGRRRVRDRRPHAAGTKRCRASRGAARRARARVELEIMKRAADRHRARRITAL